MLKPRSFDGLFTWKDFSVVAATNGVLSPEFHRVVPHQFSNMLVICSELAGRGYRRIGIVLNKEHDYSVNHAFTAAVSWQGLFGGTELVMPLVRTENSESEIGTWFRRERPDAIVVPGVVNGIAVAKELNLRVPGPIGFATANRSGVSVFAGIDERPDAIGSAAIGLLASMIQRGEKGLPAVPTVTMIKGNWLSGKSLRQPRLSAVSAK